ncbi:hypothetical protein ACFZAG_36970 [Streptomyces sp. NPDC012403]|uniref:hypothetical protein n=1 Tax=unclassified Streptomyces TaxID=2593676 RepID=UPI001C24FB05|nr:hypothetical protein [Streptomyces sp. AC558_RSS880]
MVRAVLVAGDDDARDPVAGDRPAVVVRLGEHGVPPFQDPPPEGAPPATDDGCPSRVGEATTRISDARIFS